MVIKDLEDILARLMSLDQMDDWHFALFALGIVEIGSTKKRRHKREALQAPDAMHEEGHGGEPRTGNYTHTTKDKHYGRTTSQLKDVNLFRPGSAVFVALEGGNGKLIAEPVIMALIQDCWTAGAKLLQVCEPTSSDNKALKQATLFSIGPS
jgi:hypothetical protein